MKAGRIWPLSLVMLVLLAGLSTSSAAGRVASPTGPAATPLLALVPRRNPNPPYGVIDVDIGVSGALDLGAFQMDVAFDTAFVQVEGVSVAPFLGETAGCDPHLARCAILLGPALSPGRVRFGAATFGAAAGASGDGVVAVLHLQPSGAVGTTTLTIENAVLGDVDAVPTVPETQGATLILRHAVYLPLLLRS
jgi:hypothetical protein